MTTAESFEHADCTVQIHYDEDPISPREWDQLGVMLCWHSRYVLGDLQLKDSDYAGADSVAEIVEELERAGAVEIMPLYLFDHSGISMSVSDATFRATDSAGWDWGIVGLIYATPETLERTGAPADSVRAQLIAEVSEYDDYLTGAVYGFTVETADGDMLESVWGFFGEWGLEEARRQGKEIAELEERAHSQLSFYELAH